MKNVNYSGVVSKYDELRSNALQMAHESLPEIITNKKGLAIIKSDITLSGLDFITYEKLKNWKENKERVAKWDWDSVRKKYKPHPKRFELSIWHRKQFLCGASIGKPTFSKNKLRLDYIEANPSGSPLEGTITDIVLLSGGLYAKAIGATQIRIMNPVNERVRNHYIKRGGFDYNEKHNYCFKDV